MNWLLALLMTAVWAASPQDSEEAVVDDAAILGPGPKDAGPADAPGAQKEPQTVDAVGLPGIEKPRAGVGLPGLGALKETKARRAAGVYPVYDTPEGWLLFDRGGRPKGLEAGSQFLVVGSKATGLFSVSRSAQADGCVGKRPGKVPGYLLSGRGQEALGVPIIALKAPKGRQLDLKKARLYRLVNAVDDETYRVYDKALKDAILEDVKSGAYLFKADDSLGAHYAQNPDPDKVQLKLDFGSKIRIAGVKNAFVLIEGVNISKTSRRCLRLFSDRSAAGEPPVPSGACAEMPHDLMAETQLLDFVAYDPNGKGTPFVLAYTSKEALWGHERWGYQLTRKGPRRFLMDATDPKCRERF